MYQFFVEPFTLHYMQRALLMALIIGAVGGVVSAHVVMARIAFFADALTHTVFPGVAVAFLLDGPLWLGALVAGVASAVIFTMTGDTRRAGRDEVTAVLLTSFFGLGVILVSRHASYSNDLVTLLFGRILTVDTAELVSTAIIGGIAVLVVTALRKELVLRAFDPETADAIGYPRRVLDLALNLAVTLVVVAALKAVGTALVVAILVTPAAAARLLTGSVRSLILASVGVGMAAGYLGLAVSYEASVRHGVRLAGGATIVLVLTAMFGLAVAVERVASRRIGRAELPGGTP